MLDMENAMPQSMGSMVRPQVTETPKRKRTFGKTLTNLLKVHTRREKVKERAKRTGEINAAKALIREMKRKFKSRAIEGYDFSYFHISFGAAGRKVILEWCSRNAITLIPNYSGPEGEYKFSW